MSFPSDSNVDDTADWSFIWELVQRQRCDLCVCVHGFKR